MLPYLVSGYLVSRRKRFLLYYPGSMVPPVLAMEYTRSRGIYTKNPCLARPRLSACEIHRIGVLLPSAGFYTAHMIILLPTIGVTHHRGLY